MAILLLLSQFLWGESTRLKKGASLLTQRVLLSFQFETIKFYQLSFKCVFCLERDTDAQTEVAHAIYAVRKEVALVGTVAVIGCKVQARSVCPGINVEADFGRYIESPCVSLGFEYVEDRLQLCILCAEFYAGIGLECTAAVPYVA